MLVAYSAMFIAVRRLTQDLLQLARNRAGEKLGEPDAQILNIASELAEVISKTNDAIHRAMEND